ncbi:MAG: HAD hydrolase family protein [Candidatus Hydrogenedentota bacterium]
MILNSFSKIKMIILDGDGVLNDGKVYIDVFEGRAKKYDIRDGFAIRLASEEGIIFALIAEKVTEIMKINATELGITEVHQGENKLEIYEDIKSRYNLVDEEIVYAGDDIVDIPVIIRAGVGVSVKNAVTEAKAVSDYITEREGGDGAVREIIEMVLRAKNLWDDAIKRYLSKHNPGFNYK